MLAFVCRGWQVITKQLATRVDETEERIFRNTTRLLGTTPADAMRVFVAAFNQHRGFPFDVRLPIAIDAFDDEDDALDFANRLSMKTLGSKNAE